jgi:hypothetical protein
MINRIWLSPTREEIAWEDEFGITEYDTITQRSNTVDAPQAHWTRVDVPTDR